MLEFHYLHAFTIVFIQDGTTPLVNAAVYGDSDTVQALLLSGATLDLVDNVSSMNVKGLFCKVVKDSLLAVYRK